MAEKIYVVTDDQQHMAGVLVLVPEEDSLMIENIAVEPESQGRGIGK